MGRSSRDAAGYDTSEDPEIVRLILERAAPFLPALDVTSAAASAVVRVGLRPQTSGGLPLVNCPSLAHQTFASVPSLCNL